MNDVLCGHFSALLTHEELARKRDVIHPPLRTREEPAHYRLFAPQLPGITAAETIGRFAEA